jgi:amidase
MKTGKTVGPLHGLPVSLKDQLCMKDLETIMGDHCPRIPLTAGADRAAGYVSWVGKYAKHNAVLVDIMIEAGAVPFVRTNVPQTLMVCSSCILVVISGLTWCT